MERICFHCGDNLGKKPLQFDDKYFCCIGCKGVYLLLKENHLTDFYSYESNPGLKPLTSSQDKYAFLDLPEIRQRFIRFEDDRIAKVSLSLPNIHCSSCIFLLENAHKANSKIIQSQVNFTKKLASITFLTKEMQLSELALFFDRIGYPPNFQQKKETLETNKSFILKLGLAGFAFGSIMLWSFPEYTRNGADDNSFRYFTSWLAFLVSLPVLLYSASEYYISAYKSLRAKHLNLDIPITLGILALYAQSVYSIIHYEGPGYMDSFAGFVFFLLIGKWFQNRTYQSLSFDRDYTSYFPLAVRKIKENTEEIIPIETIEIGDLLKIRNQEVIPCDSILMDDKAEIDYSFVTGESVGVSVVKNSMLYAGGKLLNASITVEVKEITDRSYLTQLWNEQLDKKKTSTYQRYQDRVAAYFLWAVLIICVISMLCYLIIAPALIMKVVVSVLIVACPCALALSSPFAFGNALRKMGQLGLYLKNSDVVEKLAEIDVIVLDKTGTLTDTRLTEVKQVRTIEKSSDLSIIISMVESSTHPISSAIYAHLTSNHENKKTVHFDSFDERVGNGLIATINSDVFKLGSASFTNQNMGVKGVFFTKNDVLITFFIVQSTFREGLSSLLNQIKLNHEIYVLSGDNNKELSALIDLGFNEQNIFFNQTPQSKLDFIEFLQNKGKRVMMVGDGLNDAPALAQANVGIAISEDMFKFTPSSDAILDAHQLKNIPDFIGISKFAKVVLRVCLAFSITYNIVGILFAVTAKLTPLVAAILMPMSSITIVGLSTFLIYFRYLRLKN
jgi:Cu+-exporting ATPase